jgi:AcrR family transcriptional regulator
MRVRTKGRRDAILAAALEVFRETGYERASMAMISRRLACSKATLYGYFPSKEELFAAAMVEGLREQSEKTFQLLDPVEPDIRKVLRRFGAMYNRLVTSRHSLALMRAAIAEGGNQKIGAELYELGSKRVLNELAVYLSRLKAKGATRFIDPRIAALHLQALLNAGTLMALVFGATPDLKPREAVRSAVEAFWSASRRLDSQPPESPSQATARKNQK